MTANFNKNLPSCECQSSSIIQETSRGSQRVGGRKNIKQNKSKESSRVFGVIEEIYSRT